MARIRLQHATLSIPHGAQEIARTFYGALLGLEEKRPPRSLDHLQVLWFVVGEDELELHLSPSDILPDGRDSRHICFAVDDLEDYRQRLSAAGKEIISDTPIPGRPRFFCRDPFDNLLEFTTIEGDYHVIESRVE